ncbi:MAG: hypothetical protein AAFP19_18725 [Bacteroidota bacterium]
MKKIILFLPIILLIACNKDTDKQGLTPLNIDNIRSFIPSGKYDRYSKIIYTDINGAEKVLYISMSDEDQIKMYDGQNYTTERLSYGLVEKDNQEYRIGIWATAQYDNASSYTQIFGCAIFTSLNNGYIPSIDIGEDGFIWGGVKRDEVLNGKSFSDVYSMGDVSNDPPDFVYNQLYYNFELGVVGFHDRENHLWVFDRFE